MNYVYRYLYDQINMYVHILMYFCICIPHFENDLSMYINLMKLLSSICICCHINVIVTVYIDIY